MLKTSELVCVNNDGYENKLAVGKVYCVVPHFYIKDLISLFDEDEELICVPAKMFKSENEGDFQ